MSFAIWFILLGVISLGIGALVESWFESSVFKFLFLPGVFISGVCRLAGARLAGLPVEERRILTGKGRGVRVNTSKAPWQRLLVLGAISFVGPVAVILVANALLDWPLKLYEQLPSLHVDSRAFVQIPTQIGSYLRQIWILLKTMAVRDPALLLWAYLLVGVLLSNAPAKRESTPLWGAALFAGLLGSLGFRVSGGSEAAYALRGFWKGLSLAFAFSLLTLVIAITLAAVERARSGSDSEKR